MFSRYTFEITNQVFSNTVFYTEYIQDWNGNYTKLFHSEVPKGTTADLQPKRIFFSRKGRSKFYTSKAEEKSLLGKTMTVSYRKGDL